MKRFALFFASVLIAVMNMASIPFVKAAAVNLAPNASVETAGNATTPQSWTSNNWGTNTAAFTYLNTGRTGSRSVKTEVISYANGDAKWYFNEIAVTPNKQYTFSDYYQANVETQVVAQYADANGNYTYEWLGAAAANSAWQQATFTFTTPATINKMTVFHVVDRVGWLILDDVNLSEYTPPAPPEVGTNLVANQSVETPNAAGNAPLGWNSNKWGTNTATFTYKKNGGYQSTNSVYVKVSNYVSGDAKWYFEPVAVKPNTSYTFSEYYQANVKTRLLAVSYDASGNPTYIDLDSAVVASKTTWKKVTKQITTLANTKTLAVFHVVERNGWLQIDNVGLTEDPPVVNTDIVPNNSLEQPSVDPNLPANWQGSSWGTNTPTFEYMNEGRSGNRSVKVTVSNYVDGDAKWYFTPLTTLQRGKQYRFSTWYKTNTIPHAVAMYIKDDGTEKYFGLPDPQPDGTANWQFYSDTFSVPVDVKAVSVFLFVSNNGWVQTDDYSITSYQPVGFNRPLVTLTFDDSQEVNVATALPLLNSYGFKTTQCYATQSIEGDAAQIQNVLAFINSGHEICSHTVSHPFLTSLDQALLTYELERSKQFLESIIGGPVRNFASPYGNYNAAVNVEIQKYYRSQRTIDEGYNSKDNFNIYRLRVQNLKSNTTLAEFQSWLDRAKADNTWLILVYHRVANDPGQFDTYVNDFTAQLQAISQSGIAVKTYNAALDEVTTQL